MILMLKLPETPARLCAMRKFVAVEVIVRAFPAQAPVPTCEPIFVTDPAFDEEALQRLAVSVGRLESVPDTQMIKAPKLGKLGIF